MSATVTFNVVFTPGTAVRLLPFSLSLLQSQHVRLRLVANACGPTEIELLRTADEGIERVCHHVLPSADPVEHGQALNQLFEAFPEPHFAFADSDVIAGGDFIGGLLPLAPGQAAVFAAPPVFRTDEEVVSPQGGLALSGARRRLQDGTFVGTTHCAIYDRTALEPVWRATPKGFLRHHRYQLSRSLKTSLARRGWLFRTFDTGRVINLQLLLAGFGLEDRPVSELHHIGGISYRDSRGSRAWIRQTAAALRSGSDNPLRVIANGVLNRIYARTQRPPGGGRGRRRRRQTVLPYFDQVLDAIVAGEPMPRTVSTDSAEVDRQVADMVAVLETEYPRGVAVLREATDAPLPGFPRIGGC